MAEFKLSAGATIDLLTKQEVDQSLAAAFDQVETAKLRGIKHMRLPEMFGIAASSKLNISETNGQFVGPKSGYAWSIKRLVITGLQSGSTFDTVGIYVSGITGQPLWVLTGNQYAASWGKLEMTLRGGETLAIGSIGTFNSTSQIIVSGELIEVPEELLGKLA